MRSLHEKYAKLLQPAGVLAALPVGSSLAQIMQIANPYREMQNRLNAWLPKGNNFPGVLEASHTLRSFTGQMQSLAALARPFDHSGLRTLDSPLHELLKVQQRLVDNEPFRTLRRQQAGWANLGPRLAEQFSGLRHLAEWSRATHATLAPTRWSDQLLDWAHDFDKAYAALEDEPAADVDADVQAPLMVATLEPLSARLETLDVDSTADVAVLRAYFEELYAALTIAVRLAVARLLRSGRTAAASTVLFAGTLGGFLALLALPSTLDWYRTKVDTLSHSEHAAATKEDLQQFKADVIASIKQAAAGQGQLRIVARRLRLRAKPTAKSTSLGTVEAGQRVVVLGTVGKRAYISCQEADQFPVHGWVLKKYLNQCPVEKL